MKTLDEVLANGTNEEFLENMIFDISSIISCDNSITPTTEIVPGLAYRDLKESLQHGLRHVRAIMAGINPVPKYDTVSIEGIRHCHDLISPSGYVGECRFSTSPKKEMINGLKFRNANVD